MKQMQSGNTLGDGVYLASLFTGWILTNITMSSIIGLITIAGGLLYACNQAFIFWKNIKKR